MSFLEIRFPESIAFDSSSILEFNTSIVTTKNGSEQRNANWSYNKMKFNIINGIKTKIELDEIITFFRNVRGRAYGFRFKDWSDYSATRQKIGVGDGKRAEFQLVKTYIINNNSYVRKITKPVLSSIKVYINDIEINEFNIDLTNGLIKFATPVADGAKIEADFEFDVPVRFNSDILEITMNTINTGNIKDITLVEI